MESSERTHGTSCLINTRKEDGTLHIVLFSSFLKYSIANKEYHNDNNMTRNIVRHSLTCQITSGKNIVSSLKNLKKTLKKTLKIERVSSY